MYVASPATQNGWANKPITVSKSSQIDPKPLLTAVTTTATTTSSRSSSSMGRWRPVLLLLTTTTTRITGRDTFK